MQSHIIIGNLHKHS